jgi:transcriptional regulator with XRE-family HTH domain
MKEELPEHLKAKDDSFAELFKEARLRAEITYRQIGAHCGKTIGYLCDVEKKRRGAPSLDVAMKIEECLFITDGRLVEAAKRERIDYSSLINNSIKARPAVINLLQNLDLISDEDLKSFTETALDKKGGQ